MNLEHEQVVPWLYRHFGEQVLPLGLFSFRYGAAEYEIHRITSSALSYGDHFASLGHEAGYYARNLTVRKSVFGLRAVFDLVELDFPTDPQ